MLDKDNLRVKFEMLGKDGLWVGSEMVDSELGFGFQKHNPQSLTIYSGISTLVVSCVIAF
jgi:hypothetical protein